MRVVRFHEYGPPEALRVDEVPEPEPGPGRLLVRVAAAGVGLADTRIRAGLVRDMLPDLPLPFSPGFEVAGTVAAVGAGADPALAGRRVAAAVFGGGYAEVAEVDAEAAYPLPDGLDDAAALALLGQGAAAVGAAEAAAIEPGETVLVQAAAGGVGGLLAQLAKRAGATVIAAVGGPAKYAAALRNGADRAVDYTAPDWADRVRESAPGGVHAVFEGTGGPVSAAAFGLLAPSVGRMVVYGASSGRMPEFDPAELYRRAVAVRGFASVLLPPAELARLRNRAFALAAGGELSPAAGSALPLAEAAAAHRALEERRTTGKTVLIP
ncbi:zinc-binding dehydrogenase [Allonocardiopsis opalescens]|uniref:NADPH2:quinone reductase n=1 Tax=Allonocardiopsis opalescens TaxID=1144618 RepID=A0A2T0QDI8_9ACTN|nr:zinc-binding dehydrogenase [Allonocardiopsis opalescens]PRY02016.1 NADPH2:quinone reductase [Allonocardiopsis opalescens]